MLQQEEGESTDTTLRIAVGEGEGYAVVSYYAAKIGCAASRLDPPTHGYSNAEELSPTPVGIALDLTAGMAGVAVNKFATWTVLQDIEGGAFGTNIPSATVDMESRMSDGCYGCPEIGRAIQLLMLVV